MALVPQSRRPPSPCKKEYLNDVAIPPCHPLVTGILAQNTEIRQTYEMCPNILSSILGIASCPNPMPMPVVALIPLPIVASIPR